MSTAKKEVVYIDIEDEITSVIDKVVSAKGKVIALVPPKRAQMLQSIVNMKLLKRRSEAAGKHIVLVTSEHALLPLAGLASVHVAKNLQSKPYIPEKPTHEITSTSNDVDVSESDAPVGELDTASASNDDELGTEELPVEPVPEAQTKKDKKKKSKNKEKKVPNFNSFRNKILLGVMGLILLIAGFIVLFKILPKATVSIKAETTRLDAAGDFTASVGASEADIDKDILIAESKEIQKSYSESFSATGEKNIGTKASGSITVRNCNYSDDFTLPAGTRFTDSSGKVFVSGQAVVVPDFSGGADSCVLSGGNSGKVEVAVESTEVGDTYNLSSRTYTISGVSGKVDAIGSQMSGGTNKIVKIVSQGDIDSIKQKLSTSGNTSEIKDELQDQFGDNFTVVESSLVGEPGQFSSEPALEQEATTAKASLVVTYKLLAIETKSLEQFIDKQIEGKYNQDDQKIYDNGIKNASLKVEKKVSDTSYSMSIRADVYVGPEINEDELKSKISGKRTGEASEIIKNTPGVRDVDVKLTPFYARSLPKPGKITVNFDVDEKPSQ